MKKTCKVCGKIKEIECFHISNTNASCLDSTCKECRNKSKMKKYYQKKELIKQLIR